jgi:hypothetical protein
VDWDALERSQQHGLLEQTIDRILYDHRHERAGLQLRNAASGREILVRVRKKAWEHLAGAKVRTQTKRRENNVPRVSRLMALATRLESLLHGGTVKDYADLARLGGVSRARITQIMNLRNLAPVIQEQLLFLSSEAGKKIKEAALRRIANETNWSRQVAMFQRLQPTEERVESSKRTARTDTPPPAPGRY